MRKKITCFRGLSVKSLRLFFILTALLMSISGSAQDIGVLKTSKTAQTPKKFAAKDAQLKSVIDKDHISTEAQLVVKDGDVPSGMARITLTAGDVWGDGSGYQLLMGTGLIPTIIPETGPLTSTCPAPAGLYDNFTYKIPTNADGDCGTTNIILDSSETIDIPAGFYDYCVANPTPGDRIWIASEGRAQNFEFKEGIAYTFTVSRNGNNDIVILSYDDPDVEIPDYLSYCTESIDDGVGTNGANTFSAAITFPAGSLTAYAGTTIHSIKVGIPETLTATISDMSVWIRNTITGENLVSKSATFVIGWNVIELDEEFTITGDDAIAIGYTLTTTGGFPLGISTNAQNAANGGHIAIGDSWTSLSANNLSGNLCIVGLVNLSVEPTERPGKVTNLSVVPGAMGALTADISFKAPTQTASKDPLATITKIDLFRGTELIKTFDAPAVGAELSYTDNLAANGTYIYSVIATNDAGESPKVSASTYVGLDIPKAPTSAKVVKDGVNGLITWVAPTAGVNGGYFAPETLTYKIIRVTDDVVIAENATGTSFTDTNIPAPGKYQYSIVAINAAGTSTVALTDLVVLGDFEIGVPYYMGFTDEEMYETWTIIDDNEDGKTWARVASTHCMRYTYHAQNPADDYLISPKIPLVAGKAYQVSFDTRAQSTSFPEKMELYLGTDPDVESIEQELWAGDVNYTTYQNIKVGLSVPEDGEYVFMFRATSDKDKFYLFMDEFKVEEACYLTGVITDGGSPVEGVSVTIEGSEATAVSAADGSYSVALTPGTYTVKTSKLGYKDSENVVTLTEAGGALDIALEAYPKYSISGTVLASDTQAGLEGAKITLKGYANYEAIAAADGTFTLADVYGEHAYIFSITASGYTAFTEEIEVEDPISGMVITLSEIAFPVTNVNVDVTSEGALVTWEAPAQGELKQYILDDGTPENGYAANPNFDPSLGNLFITSDMGMITAVDVYGQKNTAADGTRAVKAMIYDADYVLLGESAEFVVPADDWTTVELPYVPYSGDFYVMIYFSNASSYSNYVGLDQDGEFASQGCYVRQSDGTWSVLTSPGVFLIRPTAVVTGYSTRSVKAPVKTPPTRSLINNVTIQSAFAAPMASAPVAAGRTVEPKVVTLATGALYYNVYRGLSSEPTSTWTKLNADDITELSYLDATLTDAAPGMYKYGVEAVYTGGNASSFSGSDEIPYALTYTITIGEAEGGSATGAGTYAHGESVELTATADQFYYFSSWSDGVKVNPRTIIVTEDATYTPVFAKYVTPQEVAFDVTGSECLVTWNMGEAGEVADDFEDHVAFAVNSAGETGWSYIDGDGSATYTFTGIAFDHATEAMAYIVFNPSQTAPVLTPEDTPAIQPYSGNQYLACFAATVAPNNDWIISPELGFNQDFTLSFYAKTYMSDYGLERMKVLYSTTGKEMSDFTNYLAGSATAYVEVPVADWTNYTYTVPADAKYVAIQCVSNDAFVFMLDDIYIGTGVAARASGASSFNVHLDGALHGNTYNNEYLISNLTTGTHEGGVQAVYADGESEIVKGTFVVENGTGIEGFTTETLRVFTEDMTIVIKNTGDDAAVGVYDTNGRGIAKKQASTGAEIRIPVAASGVYLVTVGDTKVKVMVK